MRTKTEAVVHEGKGDESVVRQGVVVLEVENKLAADEAGRIAGEFLTPP